MDICPEVQAMLSELAKRSRMSESEYVERCIRHKYKNLAAMDAHRQSHPHYGLGRTTEYRIWYDMMRRCFDASRPEYVNYGGRGITVAPELRTLQGFIKMMGHRPKGKSLERINNNGNYERGNLRWATPLEQNSNTRSTDLITYKGKTQTLTAWARELGMSQTALWCRLYKHKWSMEEAFTRQNTHVTNRKLTDAQVIEIAEYPRSYSDAFLAAKYGISQSQISRIRTGQRWASITGL